MKKKVSIAFILLGNLIYAQSTKEVIESTRTKEAKIYFDENLQMSLIPEKIPFSKINKGQIISIKKSKEFESEVKAHERTFRVYVKAYNPLNYSFNSSSKMVVDSVNYRSDVAIDDMFKTLAVYKEGIPKKNEELVNEMQHFFKVKKGFPEASSCPHDNDLNTQLLRVVEFLKKEKNRPKEHIGWSKQLILLKFDSKSVTDNELAKMELNLKASKTSYENLYLMLDTVRTDILKKLESDGGKTECALSLEVWLVKASRIRGLIDDQKKYLDNFEQLLQKVQQEIKNWKSHELANTWFIIAKEGSISRDSSAVVELKMISHITDIDEKGQIKQADSKDTAAASIQLMWYRVFVPEVSAGVYYSLQAQNSYRMDADGSGGGTVFQINQRTFEGVAISSMLNFYLNKRDWKILPFWQVGIGIQQEKPLFMCGLGSRFGLNDRALSFACGLSVTAIKGLSDLSVGDVVTDESDIEKDLRYQFSGPKFYFGLQFHF